MERDGVKKEPSEPLIVPGINPLEELLRSGHALLYEIWVLKGSSSHRIQRILETAVEKGIPVMAKDRSDFLRFSNLNHQGIVGFIRGFPYLTIEELTKRYPIQKNPVLLALDHITDEGNLGAIIRSSCFLGAQAIVLPKDRSARISPTVIKRSSGACFCMDIAMTTNLYRALRFFREKGMWIVGTSAQRGVSIEGFDFLRPMVLVMGSESKGLSPVIEKVLDATVSIPGSERFDSLNVSSATAVILYEILRQKKAAGRI